MSFAHYVTGIERGATRLEFSSPVIILDRHEETSPTTHWELSITGAPVVTQVTRSQSRALLRLRAVNLSWSQVQTLTTLMDGGAVTVKVTPGSSSTIRAVFAPADQQSIEAHLGEHPNADSAGAALATSLTVYKADLTLLRLE